MTAKYRVLGSGLGVVRQIKAGDDMFDCPAVQLLTHPCRQCFECAVLVGEEGLAALIGNVDGAQRRVFGRVPNVAGVGVEDAARRRGAADIADDVEVRKAGDRCLSRREGEITELLQEGNELGVVDVLPG